MTSVPQLLHVRGSEMKVAFGHDAGVLQTLVEARVGEREVKAYSGWMSSSPVSGFASEQTELVYRTEEGNEAYYS